MFNPSDAICLYGTEEDIEPPLMLRAGALTAELTGGNLRYIRYGGAEVLRAASFIVRDEDWGTYPPRIGDLNIEEKSDSFSVTFSAVASDNRQSLTFDVRIEGSSDGTLSYHGRGRAIDGFLTNRTGIVVLHPIDGVAGQPVEITRTDGSVETAAFPEDIDPIQPMTDLRSLKHTTPTGLTVTCLLEGETFEMEDQRNWTDASFKTYGRPLALPCPYRVEPGQDIDQKVTISVEGQVSGEVAANGVSVAPGARLGPVPPLGLGMRPRDVSGAGNELEHLRALAPAYLILHRDRRAGHGRGDLDAQLAVARTLGCQAWLEEVITSVTDDEAADEIAALGAMAKDMGDPFTTVLVSPASDMKSTPPGGKWPETPDAAKLYDATRKAFPKARIGGGMFSYFTELNRKRPPTDQLDLVSFTTSPLVHASDDVSVMESLQSLAAVASTASKIAAGTPWAVGPSAIGVRDNPYGAAAKDNPNNIRQAMSFNDPRQRGLLGAAWNLGYFAAFATGGASAIALGAPTGAFGAIAVPMDFPQPWFDEYGGVYPVYHILRGLCALAGREMRTLDLPATGPVAGLAADTSTGVEIWLANKTPGPVDCKIPPDASVALLDTARFAEAAAHPAFMDTTYPADDGPLTLPPFAVARVLL